MIRQYRNYLHKCDNESDLDLREQRERLLKLSRVSTVIREDRKAFKHTNRGLHKYDAREI